MVYLDYSATSPLLPEAKMAMLKAMDMTGNASALHTPGHMAMNVIEDAREEIAKLINASPEEILFVSGGTEANNTITNTFAGENIAISAIEHPSLLDSAKLRCNVTILPVDERGIVSKSVISNELVSNTSKSVISNESVSSASKLAISNGLDGVTVAGSPEAENEFARSKTHGEANRQDPRHPLGLSRLALVSIMLANNEIGTINNIKSLAKESHTHGALFHTDATQALGKIKIDVKDLDVDYMTISSHKIGGPIGIGALYIKKGNPFKPLIIGGHQERGRRAGTYQTINIAGFGAAAKYTNDHKTWEIYEQKIRPLRDLLAKRILKEIPFSSVNGQLPFTLPNVLNVSFEAAEGESIQLYLDAEGGIITSTGSACASGDGKPSHVIMAIKNDAEIAHSSVRFSLGLDTTEEDINHVMKYLPNIVKRLQGISTLKAGKIKKEDSYYDKR